jgi:putative FmdB family regulatory protein
MPIFEYRCKKCGHVFEHLAKTPSDQPLRCPKCRAPKPVKQLSAFAARTEGGPSGSGSSCSTGTCPTGTCPFA